jgi:hypothetical protein
VVGGEAVRDAPLPLILGSTSSAIFAIGKEGIGLAPARLTAGHEKVYHLE